jgi:hypothetical protein
MNGSLKNLGDADNDDERRKGNRRASDNAEPLKVTIESVAKRKYSYTAKQYRLDRTRYRIEKKVFCVQCATMIFLIAYTILTGILATVSIIASETAKDALTSSHRPWVGNDGISNLSVESIGTDSITGDFTFTIKNFGPSPALSVGEAIQPFVKTVEGMKTPSGDFDKAREQACGGAYTVASIAGTSIFPQQTHTYTHSGTFRVPEIKPASKAILIEGCIAYRDQFDSSKTTHYTSFCLIGGTTNPVSLSLCGVNERAD